MKLRIALALARFAAKGRNPELMFGTRQTVIMTNALRRAARQ